MIGLQGPQLVNHRWTGRVHAGSGLKLPVQLTRLDPVVDRAAVHLEPPRQLRLSNALVKKMLSQRPRLPSAYPRTASRSVAIANSSGPVRSQRQPKSEKLWLCNSEKSWISANFYENSIIRCQLLTLNLL